MCMNLNKCVCVCPALEVNGVVFDSGLGISVISNVQHFREQPQDVCLKSIILSHNILHNYFFYSDLFLFNKLPYSVKKTKTFVGFFSHYDTFLCL